VKYLISLFVIIVPFFLHFDGAFWAEEKVVRLIDLPQKEEIEWSWSDTSVSQSGKIDNQKIREKKTQNEKEEIQKEEKEWDTKVDDKDEVQKEEKENVQWLINSYILEAYKAQWDKILKDMDLSLQKKIPDIEKRIQAYESIQTTLQLRKNRILKVNISDINKTLLTSYFDYMIQSLEKKKESLRE
jgi:hypothetical protein